MALMEIPSIQQPAGGFMVGGLGIANALTKANLENRKLELANQYYGPKTNAEIAHAISPMSLYGHDAGAMAYTNAVNPQQGINPGAAIPDVYGNSQQGQSGPGIFASLRNLIVGNQAPSNPMAQPIQSAGMQSSGPQSNNALNASPSDTAATGPANAAPTGPALPITAPEPTNGASAPVSQKDNMGFVNGSIQQKYQNPTGYKQFENALAAQGTAQSAQATNEAAQSNEQFKEAKTFARTAPIIKALSERLKEDYSKVQSWNKGPQGGLIPHWATNDPAREDAESTIASLRAQIAPTINNGHLAVANLGVAQDLKPNITLTKEGLNRITNYGEAVSSRQAEFLPLYSKLKAEGLKPDQIESVYSQYNNNHPYYDPKTGKSLNEGKYKDYITPEAINAHKAGQEFNPDQKSANNNSASENEVTFMIPNSTNTVHIPANRADEFEAAYPDHLRIGRKKHG